MKGRQVVVGVVGVIIGFILGFFWSQIVQAPESPVAAAESSLPENHPSSEEMARLQQLTEHAEHESEDREVRVALGNMLYDMGRFDSAIPWYEEALKLNPSDVLVSTDLATSYLYVGQVEKALQQYQQSLALEPDHPQTLQNMGIANFSVGEYRKAIDSWQRLLEVHPDYAHAETIRRQLESARMHLNQATTQ